MQMDIARESFNYEIQVRLCRENLRENQTAVKGGKWRSAVVSNGHSEIHQSPAKER